MKIFITGGLGFIGSNIVDALIKKGLEVTIFDNYSSGKEENIESIDSPLLHIIKGDICDSDLLIQAIKGHDIVSHHAAQLEIFLAADDPLKDLKINTIGTLNVLEASKINKVRKVINVSSACVYGQISGVVNEQSSVIPNWDYGVSKLAAERYATIYHDYKQLNVTSLRYGIVYGQREWFRRVLPIYVKRVANGEPPVVFGDGTQVRDFIHVDDVVSLHNECIFNKKADGEIFNVSSGTPTSIKDLAELTCNVSGINSRPIFERVEEGQMSKIVVGKKRNLAELNMMWLDISKAKNLLNWSPKVGLSEGLKRTLNWYQENPQRWEKIFSTMW